MIILPPLPYEKAALEPYISRNTMDFHYDKHHAGYVNNLNKFIQNTEFENMTLMDIITKSYKRDSYIDVFRNAAQAWNHTFYWHSLRAKSDSGDEESVNELFLEKINTDFGSLNQLKDELTKAALGQFGSGWAWLVLNSDRYKLEVLKTSNEYNPLLEGRYVPLLTVDVWEHAYYLDYQNQRVSYVKSIIDNIVSWSFAYDNLLMAQQL